MPKHAVARSGRRALDSAASILAAQSRAAVAALRAVAAPDGSPEGIAHAVAALRQVAAVAERAVKVAEAAVGGEAGDSKPNAPDSKSGRGSEDHAPPAVATGEGSARTKARRERRRRVIAAARMRPQGSAVPPSARGGSPVGRGDSPGAPADPPGEAIRPAPDPGSGARAEPGGGSDPASTLSGAKRLRSPYKEGGGAGRGSEPPARRGLRFGFLG